jgi:hypothetical protein
MQPPNTIISEVPFIWLPSFVVPMALLGHAVALAKVRPQSVPRPAPSDDGALSRG